MFGTRQALRGVVLRSRMSITYEQRLKLYHSKDESAYLMPSPHRSDNGELVGRVPASIALGDLRELCFTESPIKAIREKCIDCSGGNDAEVRKCVAVACALWPFRMGHNPFYGKHADGDGASPVEDAA